MPILPFLRIFRKIGYVSAITLLISMPVHAEDTGQAVQQWMVLRDSRQVYDFLSYARFINNHPAWPQINGAIRINAEAAMLRDGADNGTIVDWFDRHPPQTDEGRVRLIQALLQTGNRMGAKQQAVEFWHDGYFDGPRQARVIALVGGFSAADDAARMDNLLWIGNIARAESLLPTVDSTTRAIAKARIGLQRGSSQAPSLVQAVPGNARNQDGLLYDRIRYARRRNDDDFAAQLMQNAVGAKHGDYGHLWGKERLLLARRAFEQGNNSRAYQIAKAVGGLPKVERAELHWFAGWIALTRLNQARSAFQLFVTMHDEVATPLSKARAAYWAGAAAEQAGDTQAANQWFHTAAYHPHVFYGLMAAYALNQPQALMAQFVARNQSVSTSNPATRSDLAVAARILNRMNKVPERDLFLQALLNLTTQNKQAQNVIPVARELNSAKIALSAAKAAYQDGVLILDALFPRMPFPPQDGVDPALTLAIARQESMFDPMATSSAGARGLLQLMPGTAAHVANRYGIGYGGPQSLYQPRANLQLGQYYIKDMLDRYDGFAPLAIAAYNAGPGNVSKFLGTNGDPRVRGADWTDWVERIPFYETRNYVQRVWEAYVVYGYLLKS
jgi:soluble lytic murein transglycosylase